MYWHTILHFFFVSSRYWLYILILISHHHQFLAAVSWIFTPFCENYLFYVYVYIDYRIDITYFDLMPFINLYTNHRLSNRDYSRVTNLNFVYQSYVFVFPAYCIQSLMWWRWAFLWYLLCTKCLFIWLLYSQTTTFRSFTQVII